MKTLFPNGRTVHVWLDEMPDWTYEVIKVNQRYLSTTKRYAGAIQQLAVEMIRSGPKTHYGALGAVFIPDETQRLLASRSTLAAISVALNLVNCMFSFCRRFERK